MPPASVPAAIVLMISGMLTLALFAGFVGSSLVHAMLNPREEQFRTGEYVNHIVVLGYDDSSQFLLNLFENELDTEDTRIVVFEDHERPRELPPSILWVHGDPTKQSELDKVRLTHARAAIIVGQRHVPPAIRPGASGDPADLPRRRPGAGPAVANTDVSHGRRREHLVGFAC